MRLRSEYTALEYCFDNQAGIAIYPINGKIMPFSLFIQNNDHHNRTNPFTNSYLGTFISILELITFAKCKRKAKKQNGNKSNVFQPIGPSIAFHKILIRSKHGQANDHKYRGQENKKSAPGFVHERGGDDGADNLRTD